MERREQMSLRERTNQRLPVIDEPRGDELVNEELAALVADLEDDQNVRLSLDHAPGVLRPRAARSQRLEETEELLPGVDVRQGLGGRSVPAVVYRDKDDVRTILNMTWVMITMGHCWWRAV